MAVSPGVQRRFATGANALLVAAFALATLAVLVDLAGDHRWRLDLSSGGEATLTDDTLAALALADSRGAALTVTAFTAQRRNEEAWRRDRRMRDFLTELELVSDRVTTRLVDFDRDRLAVERMGVERYGTVVIEGAGDRVDLTEREVFRARGPKGARELDFLGEQAVSAAIRQVLSDRSRTIYVLQGHGEREIYDRGLGELRGLARIVADQGWTARSIDLLRDAEPGTPPTVPPDAAAVLLLGPRAPLAPLEDDALRAFVEGGGSALVLTDPGGTVPSVVDEAGVHVVAGVALDVVSYFPHADRPVLHYAPHAITQALADDGAATLVAHAAPLELEASSGSRLAPLLRTGRRGWAERGTEVPPAYTPGEDLEGPITVAAAVERGAGRLVVIGDVDIVSDDLLDEAPGNTTLVTNALRWILRADERFAAAGRPTSARRLVLTPEQLGLVRWMLVGGLPLLVLGAGLGVRLFRTRR